MNPGRPEDIRTLTPLHEVVAAREIVQFALRDTSAVEVMNYPEASNIVPEAERGAAPYPDITVVPVSIDSVAQQDSLPHPATMSRDIAQTLANLRRDDYALAA